MSQGGNDPPTPLIALSSAFFSGGAQNVGSPTLNFRWAFQKPQPANGMNDQKGKTMWLRYLFWIVTAICFVALILWDMGRLGQGWP